LEYLDHTDNFYESTLIQFDEEIPSIAQTTVELFPSNQGVIVPCGGGAGLPSLIK
jgi:hypothetical protein